MKSDSVILGNIIPIDSDLKHAEAMVTKGGKIVYVGTKEIAMKLCDEKTAVYDYGENFIFPGFFDSHCHGLSAGQRMVFQCDLIPGKSMEEYAEIFGKYVKENPGRDFYLGAGWEKHAEPTAKMLDDVCPDKPAVLTSIDGHSMWVNTAAMKAVGCDAALAKELGEKQIHVDSNGNPTGVVCERGTVRFSNAFVPSKEDIKEGLLAWQEFAFSHGMTSVVEANADTFPDAIDAYQELADEGKWKLRTYAFPFLRDYMAKGPDAVADKVYELSQKHNGEYFKISGLKQFVDGVVEARTAYLKEEYSDEPGYYGIFNLKGREQLAQDIVTAVNAKGLPVHFHTVGDAAVGFALDLIEKSQYENCNFDLRNLLCHLQLVSKEDIKRTSDLNVGAIVAPLWVPKEEAYFIPEVQYLGEDRAYECYPVKAFEDAGATVAFHTDYPITAVVDIPLEIYEAMRRRNQAEGVKTVKNPDECISALQSILALTLNAAYICHEENNLGTLSIGKVANAVVFDRDFLHCEVEEIPSAKLVATIVDGQEVYKA